MKRTVEGRVHYTGSMAERPRFYANDHSRDAENRNGHSKGWSFATTHDIVGRTSRT
jgi:hypothetical protein